MICIQTMYPTSRIVKAPKIRNGTNANNTGTHVRSATDAMVKVGYATGNKNRYSLIVDCHIKATTTVIRQD